RGQRPPVHPVSAARRAGLSRGRPYGPRRSESAGGRKDVRGLCAAEVIEARRTFMWKRFACVSAAIAAMFLLLPRAGANKNFVPDWTFQGSSLGAARTLG